VNFKKRILNIRVQITKKNVVDPLNRARTQNIIEDLKESAKWQNKKY